MDTEESKKNGDARKSESRKSESSLREGSKTDAEPDEVVQEIASLHQTISKLLFESWNFDVAEEEEDIYLGDQELWEDFLLDIQELPVNDDSWCCLVSTIAPATNSAVPLVDSIIAGSRISPTRPFVRIIDRSQITEILDSICQRLIADAEAQAELRRKATKPFEKKDEKKVKAAARKESAKRETALDQIIPAPREVLHPRLMRARALLEYAAFLLMRDDPEGSYPPLLTAYATKLALLELRERDVLAKRKALQKRRAEEAARMRAAVHPTLEEAMADAGPSTAVLNKLSNSHISEGTAAVGDVPEIRDVPKIGKGVKSPVREASTLSVGLAAPMASFALKPGLAPPMASFAVKPGQAPPMASFAVKPGLAPPMASFAVKPSIRPTKFNFPRIDESVTKKPVKEEPVVEEFKMDAPEDGPDIYVILTGFESHLPDLAALEHVGVELEVLLKVFDSSQETASVSRKGRSVSRPRGRSNASRRSGPRGESKWRLPSELRVDSVKTSITSKSPKTRKSRAMSKIQGTMRHRQSRAESKVHVKNPKKQMNAQMSSIDGTLVRPFWEDLQHTLEEDPPCLEQLLIWDVQSTPQTPPAKAFDAACLALYRFLHDARFPYDDYQCQLVVLEVRKAKPNIKRPWQFGIYNDLRGMVPPECVSIPYIMHCLLEQTVENVKSPMTMETLGTCGLPQCGLLYEIEQVDNCGSKDTRLEREHRLWRHPLPGTVLGGCPMIQHGDKETLRTYHVPLPDVKLDEIVVRMLKGLAIPLLWRRFPRKDGEKRMLQQFHVHRLWTMAEDQRINVDTVRIFLHVLAMDTMKAASLGEGYRQRSYAKDTIRGIPWKSDPGALLIREAFGPGHYLQSKRRRDDKKGEDKSQSNIIPEEVSKVESAGGKVAEETEDTSLKQKIPSVTSELRVTTGTKEIPSKHRNKKKSLKSKKLNAKDEQKDEQKGAVQKKEKAKHRKSKYPSRLDVSPHKVKKSVMPIKKGKKETHEVKKEKVKKGEGDKKNKKEKKKQKINEMDTKINKDEVSSKEGEPAEETVSKEPVIAVVPEKEGSEYKALNEVIENLRKMMYEETTVDRSSGKGYTGFEKANVDFVERQRQLMALRIIERCPDIVNLYRVHSTVVEPNTQTEVGAVEDMTRRVLLQELFSLLDDFTVVDYHYFAPTDSLLLHCYHDGDARGLAKRAWATVLPTKVGLRDFILHVMNVDPAVRSWTQRCARRRERLNKRRTERAQKREEERSSMLLAVRKRRMEQVLQEEIHRLEEEHARNHRRQFYNSSLIMGLPDMAENDGESWMGFPNAPVASAVLRSTPTPFTFACISERELEDTDRSPTCQTLTTYRIGPFEVCGIVELPGESLPGEDIQVAPQAPPPVVVTEEKEMESEKTSFHAYPNERDAHEVAHSLLGMVLENASWDVETEALPKIRTRRYRPLCIQPDEQPRFLAFDIGPKRVELVGAETLYTGWDGVQMRIERSQWHGHLQHVRVLVLMNEHSIVLRRHLGPSGALPMGPFHIQSAGGAVIAFSPRPRHKQKEFSMSRLSSEFSKTRTESQPTTRKGKKHKARSTTFEGKEKKSKLGKSKSGIAKEFKIKDPKHKTSPKTSGVGNSVFDGDEIFDELGRKIHGPFAGYDVSLSWPSGLCIKLIANGVEEMPLHVRQRYTTRGPMVQRTEDELMRDILPTGEVCVWNADQSVTVMRPDSSIWRIFKWGVSDEVSNPPPRSTTSEVSEEESGNTSRRSTKKKNRSSMVKHLKKKKKKSRVNEKEEDAEKHITLSEENSVDEQSPRKRSTHASRKKSTRKSKMNKEGKETERKDESANEDKEEDYHERRYSEEKNAKSKSKGEHGITGEEEKIRGSKTVDISKGESLDKAPSLSVRKSAKQGNERDSHWEKWSRPDYYETGSFPGERFLKKPLNYDVTTPDGRTLEVREGRVAYEHKPMAIRCAVDPRSGEVFQRRGDGTTVVLSEDGTLTVTFRDSTRITVTRLLDRPQRLTSIDSLLASENAHDPRNTESQSGKMTASGKDDSDDSVHDSQRRKVSSESRKSKRASNISQAEKDAKRKKNLTKVPETIEEDGAVGKQVKKEEDEDKNGREKEDNKNDKHKDAKSERTTQTSLVSHGAAGAAGGGGGGRRRSLESAEAGGGLRRSLESGDDRRRSSQQDWPEGRPARSSIHRAGSVRRTMSARLSFAALDASASKQQDSGSFFEREARMKYVSLRSSVLVEHPCYASVKFTSYPFKVTTYHPMGMVLRSDATCCHTLRVDGRTTLYVGPTRVRIHAAGEGGGSSTIIHVFPGIAPDFPAPSPDEPTRKHGRSSDAVAVPFTTFASTKSFDPTNRTSYGLPKLGAISTRTLPTLNSYASQSNVPGSTLGSSFPRTVSSEDFIHWRTMSGTRVTNTSTENLFNVRLSNDGSTPQKKADETEDTMDDEEPRGTSQLRRPSELPQIEEPPHAPLFVVLQSSSGGWLRVDALGRTTFLRGEMNSSFFAAKFAESKRKARSAADARSGGTGEDSGGDSGASGGAGGDTTSGPVTGGGVTPSARSLDDNLLDPVAITVALAVPLGLPNAANHRFFELRRDLSGREYLDTLDVAAFLQASASLEGVELTATPLPHDPALLQFNVMRPSPLTQSERWLMPYKRGPFVRPRFMTRCDLRWQRRPAGDWFLPASVAERRMALARAYARARMHARAEDPYPWVPVGCSSLRYQPHFSVMTSKDKISVIPAPLPLGKVSRLPITRPRASITSDASLHRRRRRRGTHPETLEMRYAEMEREQERIRAKEEEDERHVERNWQQLKRRKQKMELDVEMGLAWIEDASIRASEVKRWVVQQRIMEEHTRNYRNQMLQWRRRRELERSRRAESLRALRYADEQVRTLRRLAARSQRAAEREMVAATVAPIPEPLHPPAMVLRSFYAIEAGDGHVSSMLYSALGSYCKVPSVVDADYSSRDIHHGAQSDKQLVFAKQALDEAKAMSEDFLAHNRPRSPSRVPFLGARPFDPVIGGVPAYVGIAAAEAISAAEAAAAPTRTSVQKTDPIETFPKKPCCPMTVCPINIENLRKSGVPKQNIWKNFKKDLENPRPFSLSDLEPPVIRHTSPHALMALDTSKIKNVSDAFLKTSTNLEQEKLKTSNVYETKRRVEKEKSKTPAPKELDYDTDEAERLTLEWAERVCPNLKATVALRNKTKHGDNEVGNGRGGWKQQDTTAHQRMSRLRQREIRPAWKK